MSRKRKLIVEKLMKRFGKVTAVNNVSFEVYDGEIFAMIGPSGAGKTTILRCIAGLETPDSGSIYLDRVDISETPIHKRGMGMVFQDLALFSHMNVFDNVAFGPRMMGHKSAELKKEVEEVLRLVRLEGLGHRRITELSGGQLQRVALGRSLALKPRILLFDEPLADLDPELRERMMVEIRDLHRKLGFTALYVTHDQEQAMTMANRIMVMNMGSIEQIGTPEEVYLNPTTLFVAKFVGELNMLSGEVTSVKNGTLLVQTNVGKFTARRGKTELKGKSVVYCIRPEKISVGQKAQNLDNKVKVKFIDQIYKGSVIRYILQLKNGVEFKSVSEAYGPVNLESSINRDIIIGWKSKDALVFEA